MLAAIQCPPKNRPIRLAPSRQILLVEKNHPANDYTPDQRKQPSPNTHQFHTRIPYHSLVIKTTLLHNNALYCTLTL